MNKSRKGLLLTLNAMEDDGIRNFVNELIEGEVKKILRGELKPIIDKTISQLMRKMVEGTVTQYNINSQLNKVVSDLVKADLEEIKKTFKVMMQEELRKVIKAKAKEIASGL